MGSRSRVSLGMENSSFPVPTLLASMAGLCIPQEPWGQQQGHPVLLVGSGLPHLHPLVHPILNRYIG